MLSLVKYDEVICGILKRLGRLGRDLVELWNVYPAIDWIGIPEYNVYRGWWKKLQIPFDVNWVRVDKRSGLLVVEATLSYIDRVENVLRTQLEIFRCAAASSTLFNTLEEYYRCLVDLIRRWKDWHWEEVIGFNA
jgi:hypothetical protein